MGQRPLTGKIFPDFARATGDIQSPWFNFTNSVEDENTELELLEQELMDEAKCIEKYGDHWPPAGTYGLHDSAADEELESLMEGQDELGSSVNSSEEEEDDEEMELEEEEEAVEWADEEDETSSDDNGDRYGGPPRLVPIRNVNAGRGGRANQHLGESN